MTANYGAHEIMELHEVLNAGITDINTIQLYRPHVKDTQLASIVDKHLQFMVQSYNSLVQTVSHIGNQQAIPYRAPKNVSPTYGLRQPAPMSPSMSINEIDDRDIASAVLNLHKTSATCKIRASLECADPQLRSAIQQSAVNCGEQAYEIWQFMNQRGYYQVPTMKEMTTNTMVNVYQPVTGNLQTTAGYPTTGSYQATSYANQYQPTLTSNMMQSGIGAGQSHVSHALTGQGAATTHHQQATVFGQPYDARHTANQGYVSPASLVFQGNVSQGATQSLHEQQHPYTAGAGLSNHAAHAVENQNATHRSPRLQG